MRADDGNTPQCRRHNSIAAATIPGCGSLPLAVGHAPTRCQPKRETQGVTQSRRHGGGAAAPLEHEGPPHFNVEEQAMYTAALKELENHRLRMLQRAKYFEGKEPENERTAGNILLGSEGVRIISNKEHKSLLVSYDYGALLWCTLTTDSSRQGPRQAIRHNG